MNVNITKPVAWMAVFLGIVIVGVIDYATGIEIRVFPLYFLPLVFAAIRFGKREAIFSSALATAVWEVSNHYAGLTYSSDYIWVINTITQGAAFVTISVLVASLRDALDREKILSQTDPLTGLLNSGTFRKRASAVLDLCVRKQRPAALAFMDLDNFKNVNDTVGHEQGDIVLKKVADVFCSHLRRGDIFARFGGDEFSIFLPETDEAQATIVLRRIKDKLLESEVFQKYSVGTSIGAVVYPVASGELNEMLKQADMLMYGVKKEGKNSIKIESYVPMSVSTEQFAAGRRP